MSEAKFKVGDTVRLKSGSPLMTVEMQKETLEGKFNGNYKCVWFEGSKKHSGDFPEDTLDPDDNNVFGFGGTV